MARLARVVAVDVPHHVTQRANGAAFLSQLTPARPNRVQLNDKKRGKRSVCPRFSGEKMFKKSGKPKIGDLYEIKIGAELAYIQYTHSGAAFGDLIRVLPGKFSARPQDLASLARQKELYFIFTTLYHGLRKKELEFIGNFPIPESAAQFPTMRKEGARSREGKVVNWYIGPAQRINPVQELQQALPVRELAPDQKKLSVFQRWPVSTRALEIAQGWLPERSEELEKAARKEHDKNQQNALNEGLQFRFVDHFLYFSKQGNAGQAAERLKSGGWSVEVRMGADQKNWLVLAKQPAPVEDIEQTREQLERLADEFHGEYDGWGANV